jgi:hypothetical protein
MTKNELAALLNINLINAVRLRDGICADIRPEQYGYHHGQYRAYEQVISMLTIMDIETLSADDDRHMN